MLYSFFVPAPAGANICSIKHLFVFSSGKVFLQTFVYMYKIFLSGYNRNIKENTKKLQKIKKNYNKSIDKKK